MHRQPHTPRSARLGQPLIARPDDQGAIVAAKTKRIGKNSPYGTLEGAGQGRYAKHRINSLQAAVNPVETIPPIGEALQTTPDIEVVETPQGTENPAEEPTELASIPGQGNEIIPQPTEIANPETPIPTVDDAPVQLYVTVLRRAWMRVSVDGDLEFEGRVIPGSAYSFSGEFQIELLTGNGAALQVFFNGEDLGVLGVYGEVVYEVYTPQGVVLPTPTNTPVPTNTPPASPTPPATVVP